VTGVLWNFVLALAWIALSGGGFTFKNFLIGLILGYLILRFTKPWAGSIHYFSKLPKIIELFVYFLYELIVASLRVAYDVVTPRHHMRPGIIHIPLQLKTDFEITLLANMLSLTPGSLSLDVSTDRKVLYLHAMYVDNPQEVRDMIHEGFEKRIKEIFE